MSKAADNIRFVIIMAATLFVMSLGALRLMKLQLVDGSSYLQKSLSSNTAEQVINAPRGEIADSSGEYLVSNKAGFNAVIQKAFFPTDNREINRIILKVANVLEEENVSWEDALPISENAPFEFLPDRESDIARLRKNIGVQVYGTAEECIIAMTGLYETDPQLTDREKRIIAGVRYTMYLRDFSVSNRYTFAEDITMEAVVRLKELTYELDGVDIVQEAVREVKTGDVIPHLIGTVGAISAEEYDQLKGSGYALNDTLGKGGIEKAMESTLRGKKGVRTLEIQGGAVVNDEITEEAVPGNTIKLTVDSDYQRKVQTILENHIYWLNNQTSSKAKGTEANAGALVVLDARSGALLAGATAPTYDLKDYLENYSKVANGENSPLLNRVTSGLYRPGSTFKTVTATAALNEGIISPTDVVNCQKYYTYWEGWSPECTGYHGRLNVVGALRESCNIFFYEVGRVMGIDRITEYASKYGLGEEMGLETGRGVKTGYIASPDTFEARQQVWQAGNVIQAAIGQSDTYVTPLQMADQALMIGNRGVRYQTYMVDSVYTYNMEELVSKTEPTVAAVIEDKTGHTFDKVIEGMEEAAAFKAYTYPTVKEYYTDSYLLTELPKKAAIKTGTPQMTSKSDTGSAFIGFYPADDPDIAFSGFVEKGEYSKLMIRELIEAYYNKDYHIEKLGGRTEEELAAALSDNEDTDSFDEDNEDLED
ncbi:MAG: penicillin-binding transpeptidase domain-containing protein [Huintestinicola sp.]|uniref:penicillin-binding transpeptidase domain-containing protein n=1 Tax=Huintestinicola sp. TaxID=2981661 RepID=UPI003EFF29F5